MSRVDNARELEASLVTHEADDWRCVWEQRPGMLDWEQYSYTALAGTQGYRIPLSLGLHFWNKLENPQHTCSATQQHMDGAVYIHVSPSSRMRLCVDRVLLLLPCSAAGLRTIALRVPEGVVGVSHVFRHKQGLSNPSLMQLWMSAGISQSSSSNLSDCESASGSEDLAVDVDVCPTGADGPVKRAGAAAAPAIAVAGTGGRA